MKKIAGASSFVVCAFFLLCLLATAVQAAEVKVAVLDIQIVLTKSSAGVAAKGKIEQRMKELKASLDKDKEQLMTLQDEMKKKASVWSEEKKQEQGLEFQKKRRDLSVKQDDANLEMKNLQEKYLAPIMKELESIVKKVAKEKGYSIVLPNTAVLYFDDAVNITEEIVAALNAEMK